MTPNQLPPLPPAAHRGPNGTGAYFDSYTADQMHAYALAAIAQQAQEPVSKLHHMLVMGHEPWEIPAETIERDAIRYRWLRQQFWDDGVMCVVMNPKSNVTLGATCPSLKMLDKAIDTSMCATPPAPQVPAPVDERDAEIAELRAEVLAWRKQCDRLTHQVICCGVAASHPDATLTTRGAYAGRWNSRQAEEVRKLRAERDALASLQSPAPQTKGQP